MSGVVHLKRFIMKIFKKNFWENFFCSLEKENKEIKIEKIGGFFCFKKKKREWIGIKAFEPLKEVRMAFIVCRNYKDKKKRKVNFIFSVGIPDLKLSNIKYKEIYKNSFSIQILNEKELKNEFKSFLLQEKINVDYFINNKFKE